MFKNGWKNNNVSQRVGTFETNAAQRVLPRCNKAKHFVNTTNSVFFTSNKFDQHKNSLSERIWFCLINKEQFATANIPTRNKNLILNRSDTSWNRIFHKDRGKATLINDYLCQLCGVRDLEWWVKNDQYIAIPSVAFNCEQLEMFHIFWCLLHVFKANQIIFSLVILYKQ